MVVGAGIVVAVVVEDGFSVHRHGSVYVVAIGWTTFCVKAALIALCGYCDVSEGVVICIQKVKAVVLVGISGDINEGIVV